MAMEPGSHDEADVLIIGGGPTGQALALELLAYRVPFRIIDKAHARSNRSRALVIQPRTLELLNRHGDITQELVAEGTTGVGGRIFAGKKPLSDITFEDLGFDDTAFKLPLWISQAKTEAILDKQLQERGRAVEMGVRADTVQESDSGVHVTLIGSDGVKSTLRSKYVVGCDGAHSVVRHAAGLKFDGAPYAQQFILCDAHLKGEYPKNRISFFLGQKLVVIFPFKGGDLVRIISVRPDHAAEVTPDLAEFQAIIDAVAPTTGEPWTLYDAVWLANFRFHRRGVDRYRAGRLFVAGDAAHIHSPAGGQGMNTGIQDAINLGWKLALVLQGQRSDAFLNTYDEERRPVGDHLLQGTDRIFSWASSSHPLVSFVRTNLVPWILPWLSVSPSRRAGLFRFVSQFAIRYRRSSIVGTATGHHGPVMGGYRAPDGELVSAMEERRFLQALCSSVKHTVVVFLCSGETEAVEKNINRLDGPLQASKMLRGAGRISIHCPDEKVDGSWRDKDGTLHRRYGFSECPGFVLVRPDLYLAYIGKLDGPGMDQFAEWLSAQERTFGAAL